MFIVNWIFLYQQGGVKVAAEGRNAVDLSL
jgi:hypothetical protein